jgi:hypothetical protein
VGSKRATLYRALTGTEQECWEYVTAQKICGDRQTTYLVWSQKDSTLASKSEHRRSMTNRHKIKTAILNPKHTNLGSLGIALKQTASKWPKSMLYI